MLEALNNQQLCEQLCAQVTLRRRENGMIMLETPFSFPDGDQYPLYLTETRTGGVRVSDGGHTLLHLSYENDIDKLFSGTRAVLLEKIIKEQGIQYDEPSGQFFIEAAVVDLSRATFQLGQALTSVYDLTFLNRSRVASTFYDDLYEQILDVVSSEKVHRSFEIPGLANAQFYEVDFCIDGKNGVPLYLIGIPNQDKARLATIFLEYYHRNEIEFESLLVFENQQEMPRADLARLSNIGGEMISSLNAEDDFRRKLLKKAA